jgi:hypothetical protein
MRRISIRKTAVLAAGLSLALCASAAESTWQETDKVFGQHGKPQPGEVQKYSWPRRDLHVSIGKVPVRPALALGSWAAFHGEGPAAMVMGDLVLLGAEVNPVVVELQEGGFEILAVHNHLIGESPRLLYVHYMGRGQPAALASTLKAALSKTATPMGAAPSARPTGAETKLLDAFQTALGRKGTMAGNVLQIGVPRSEAIADGGMEIPPSMGMAESINVEAAGRQVATTGDFVLVADEVNPVIRELESHGISITALHSHMLRESPRLFFMHFWGVGAPEKIGEGLRAALAKVATKP